MGDCMQQIIYTLLNYVNNAMNEDTYYTIALSLLANIHEVESCSLEKISSLCNVSCATMNRFCKRIGYDNYSTLRQNLRLSNIQDIHHASAKISTQKEVNELIFKSFDEVILTSLNEIDTSLKIIHQGQRIVIVGYGHHQILGYLLQKNLFSCGKMCEVPIDRMKQLSLIQSLGENDVLIVTSLSGQYFNTRSLIEDYIKHCPCQKILITQMGSKKINLKFDSVIRIGQTYSKKISHYIVMRIYDLIVERYTEQYVSEIRE